LHIIPTGCLPRQPLGGFHRAAGKYRAIFGAMDKLDPFIVGRKNDAVVARHAAAA
jgi:hypothetical protein